MEDIVFPVGNAAEESCPQSTRGQFLISWQGGEGAFVRVGTACQSAIFTEHLLCGTWKGKEDGPCPQEPVTKEGRKVPSYCKRFSICNHL